MQTDAAEAFLREAIAIRREMGDTTAVFQSTASLAAALITGRRLEDAGVLLEPAVVEAEGVADDCDLAALLSALGRVRFSQDRVAEGLELVDRALPIAEHEELNELLIDTLVIKGSLLSKARRPLEGMALVEAARRLAVESELPAWEVRALVSLSLDLAIRDPRAAVELERQAIAIARRIGRRDMELLLIGNAGEDSFRTGEWSFQAAEFASLDELEIEASTRLPMEGASTVIALLRGEIDMTELAARYAGIMDDIQDNDFASNEIDMRAWGAFADGRFDEAASGWMEMADMSALNAPYVLPRAAGMALLARDATHARLALERMVATGAHGRAIDMDKTAIRAGLAALDGSTQEAIAGFRAAIAGWRDLGLPWDEAMTSLIFVRLVGTGSPEARAAAESGTLDPGRARGAAGGRDPRRFRRGCGPRRRRRTGGGDGRPDRDGPGGEQPGLSRVSRPRPRASRAPRPARPHPPRPPSAADRAAARPPPPGSSRRSA